MRSETSTKHNEDVLNQVYPQSTRFVYICTKFTSLECTQLISEKRIWTVGVVRITNPCLHTGPRPSPHRSTECTSADGERCGDLTCPTPPRRSGNAAGLACLHTQEVRRFVTLPPQEACSAPPGLRPLGGDRCSPPPRSMHPCSGSNACTHTSMSTHTSRTGERQILTSTARGFYPGRPRPKC